MILAHPPTPATVPRPWALTCRWAFNPLLPTLHQRLRDVWWLVQAGVGLSRCWQEGEGKRKALNGPTGELPVYKAPRRSKFY